MSGFISDRLIANYDLFAALPKEAHDEMRVTLGEIGQDVLQLQKAAVPVYAGKPRKDVTPGALKGALQVAEAVEFLRVRIGLPQLKGRRSNLFYGVIVEYGRKAQIVPLRRLKRGARADWRARVRAGTARFSTKPADLLSKTDTLKVTALPARRFVHIDNLVDAGINRRLTDFWDRVLARADA